jgi:SAM-dependent methyltransferase
MHDNSMKIMAEFAKDYEITKETVVDIGAYDINGTYKSLFPEAKYIGVDTNPGPNVDVIINSPEWDKLKNVDVVISGQTLEHVADIPALMASIFDVLKSGGIACIIAPSAGEAHYYPIWTGNVSKEQMVKYFQDAGFEVISCTISEVGPFLDNCCIGRKPEPKKGKKIDEGK